MSLKEAKIRHHKTGTPEYGAWSSMKDRCLNPNNRNFHNYGGRGIMVCERWRGDNGFVNFYADMGERPSSKHSLDRIDNEGNYEPSNCRWATSKEQLNNTRFNRFITFQERTQTLQQWATELDMSYSTLFFRLRKGLPLERVFAKTNYVYKRLDRVTVLKLINTGLSQGAIARKFGVDQSAVSCMLRRIRDASKK